MVTNIEQTSPTSPDLKHRILLSVLWFLLTCGMHSKKRNPPGGTCNYHIIALADVLSLPQWRTKISELRPLPNDTVGELSTGNSALTIRAGGYHNRMDRSRNRISGYLPNKIKNRPHKGWGSKGTEWTPFKRLNYLFQNIVAPDD